MWWGLSFSGVHCRWNGKAVVSFMSKTCIRMTLFDVSYRNSEIRAFFWQIIKLDLRTFRACWQVNGKLVSYTKPLRKSLRVLFGVCCYTKQHPQEAMAFSLSFRLSLHIWSPALLHTCAPSTQTNISWWNPLQHSDSVSAAAQGDWSSNTTSYNQLWRFTLHPHDQFCHHPVRAVIPQTLLLLFFLHFLTDAHIEVCFDNLLLNVSSMCLHQEGVCAVQDAFLSSCAWLSWGTNIPEAQRGKQYKCMTALFLLLTSQYM